MKPFRPVFALALCATLGFITPGFAGDDVILRHPLRAKPIDLSQFADLDTVDLEGVHLGQTLTEAQVTLMDRGYEMTPLKRWPFHDSTTVDGVKFRFEGLSYPSGAQFVKDENGMHQIVSIGLTSPYRGSVIHTVSRTITWLDPEPGQPARNPPKLALRNLLIETYGPTDGSCWIVSEGKVLPQTKQARCDRHDVHVSASINSGGIDTKDPTALAYKLHVGVSSRALGDRGDLYKIGRPLMDKAANDYLDEQRAKVNDKGVVPKL